MSSQKTTFHEKRRVRAHDKLELSITTLYGIPVIRNLVHLCISLSFQLVFQSYLLFSLLIFSYFYSARIVVVVNGW